MVHLIKLSEKMKDIRAWILTHRHGRARPLSGGHPSLFNEFLTSVTGQVDSWCLLCPYTSNLAARKQVRAHKKSWCDTRQTGGSSTKDKMWNLMGLLFFFCRLSGFESGSCDGNCYTKKKKMRINLMLSASPLEAEGQTFNAQSRWIILEYIWPSEISGSDCEDVITLYLISFHNIRKIK